MCQCLLLLLFLFDIFLLRLKGVITRLFLQRDVLLYITRCRVTIRSGIMTIANCSTNVWGHLYIFIYIYVLHSVIAIFKFKYCCIHVQLQDVLWQGVGNPSA